MLKVLNSCKKNLDFINKKVEISIRTVISGQRAANPVGFIR